MLVGTSGRPGSLQPANLANGDSVFAVIVYNTGAVQTQSGIDYGAAAGYQVAYVDPDLVAAEAQGLNQGVQPVSLFIHESQENLAFWMQLNDFGRKMVPVSPRICHRYGVAHTPRTSDWWRSCGGNGKNACSSLKEVGKVLRMLCILWRSAACAVVAFGQCAPASDSLRTQWGHQNVVIVNSKPVKTLRGTVLLGYGAPNVSKESVLVEVYDHPELAMGGDQGRTGQNRLMACVSRKDGSFSFDLPADKYELRCSKPVEWNCTSVIVEVAKNGSSKPLTVRLELAE